ncbi:hypothetical protein BD779DRAFT_813807 [Infundibulicybe gibba]|nr:hypothetical protein BD779DRAFT_813807 [Infundibulicybe gibba]
MFAFLALNLPDRIQASTPGSGGGGNPMGTNPRRNVGAITGGTLGGVAVVGLAGLCLLLWKRHQKCKALTPASGLDPFPYSHISSTGNVYGSRPRRKSCQDSRGQHIGHRTVTPNDSPAPSVVSQRPEPGPRGTSTGNGTASRDPRTRALPPPQLNPATSPSHAASVLLSDPAPSQTDVARRLRDDMEILLSEMADILAQRAYDADEAPPQYRTMATTISSHRD